MEAEAQAKRQAQTPTQQPPVIIQQPPAQQAPVVIQQPLLLRQLNQKIQLMIQLFRMPPQNGSQMMSEMDSVAVTVLNGKALIIWNVTSAVSKTKAEQIVRAVRGVKSVENKVTVSSS